ncbi:MAG: YIEGIA domain-containing protein [Firmicutes bacterium]|nr:YIEGIA domain-containing protein [Bacillota bacterium]
MMRIDYRQFPGYPHGRVIQLALGLVAAFLGALAIPALVAREFTAVTFLALAAQQFREVRGVERETLARLDEIELVARGPHYVEGIARVIEARNYLTIGTALLVSGVTWFTHWIGGVAALGAAIVAMDKLMEGRTIGDIARLRIGCIRFQGPHLYVDDIHIMNLGLPENQEVWKGKGRGVIIEPLDAQARSVLASTGQRQAIAHDVSVLVGTRKDFSAAELTPLARRDPDSGRIGFAIVPENGDEKLLLKAVSRVPVLEAAQSSPFPGG